MTQKDNDPKTSNDPDRRQVLAGGATVLMRPALPVAALTAGLALRPGGWILLGSDRDVS